MRLDAAVKAVAMAMYDLERKVKAEGSIRTTTGDIFATMHSTVTTDPDGVVGTLYANDYWEAVGSGRKPGRMPPLDKIQDWINRAGLSVSAWAVAKGIAKRGSKAWREKKPNVFLTAIEAWKQGPAFAEVSDIVTKDVERVYLETITQIKWPTSRV
jgi:hypothetical protein